MVWQEISNFSFVDVRFAFLLDCYLNFDVCFNVFWVWFWLYVYRLVWCVYIFRLGFVVLDFCWLKWLTGGFSCLILWVLVAFWLFVVFWFILCFVCSLCLCVFWGFNVLVVWCDVTVSMFGYWFYWFRLLNLIFGLVIVLVFYLAFTSLGCFTLDFLFGCLYVSFICVGCMHWFGWRDWWVWFLALMFVCAFTWWILFYALILDFVFWHCGVD